MQDIIVDLPTQTLNTLQCGINASQHACFLSCLSMKEFYDMGTEDPTSIEDYDIMRSGGVMWANAAHFILRTTFEDIVRQMTQALPIPDPSTGHPTSIPDADKVALVLQCAEKYYYSHRSALILTEYELVSIHDLVCDLVINKTPFPTRKEMDAHVSNLNLEYACVLWVTYMDACGACGLTPDNGEGGCTTPNYIRVGHVDQVPTSETDPSNVVPFRYKDDTRDDN